MFRTIGCFVHIRCASALGVGHGNGEERAIDKWILMHAECIAAYVQVTDAMGERLAIHNGLAAICGQGGAGEHTLGAGDRCWYISG